MCGIMIRRQVEHPDALVYMDYKRTLHKNYGRVIIPLFKEIGWYWEKYRRLQDIRHLMRVHIETILT